MPEDDAVMSKRVYESSELKRMKDDERDFDDDPNVRGQRAWINQSGHRLKRARVLKRRRDERRETWVRRQEEHEADVAYRNRLALASVPGTPEPLPRALRVRGRDLIGDDELSDAFANA